MKPGMAIILGGGGPKHGHSEPEIEGYKNSEDDGRPEAKRTAMQAFIDAVSGGDVDAAVSAHEHLMQVCGY
jgi:hypothetical protein